MEAMYPPAKRAIKLAQRMSGIKSSAVREILKVTERPDIISFAGGLPAPELFPVDAINAAFDYVLKHEGAGALQYSTTEGFLPLRSRIVERINRFGGKAIAENTIITNGSQQGIDLVAKVLLDPGDYVVVENPSYLAALQAFGAYEANFLEVDSDENGMVVDELEILLQRHAPKLIYIVPNFNNPTGRTLSLVRRKKLVRLAQRFGVVILEDDPYGELRFRGEALPSLQSLDHAGQVVSLGSFSKTFAPGLRVGWLTGPASLVRAITVAKQSADLHTSSIAQRVIARLFDVFDYDAHIAHLRGVYRERATTMLELLPETLPSRSHWSNPDGGMFVWVELPGGFDSEHLLQEAVESKVAFVPGNSFFANSPRPECLRLNFSNQSPEKIGEGLLRLKRLFRKTSIYHY